MKSSSNSAEMSAKRFRFAEFQLNARTGELLRHGLRVRLHVQPFQILLFLLERPGDLVTREELARVLWPEGTFVDFEHGLNSAINRLRDALGDRASQPRLLETLPRRGYRFLATVEILSDSPTELTILPSPAETLEPNPEPLQEQQGNRGAWSLLAQPLDLPQGQPTHFVRGLFLGLQAMYLAFYIGTLANAAEIHDLLAPLPPWVDRAAWTSAALLIAVRVFLISAVAFGAPGFRGRFLRLWPALLLADLAWSLAPYLLLHHISVGLATACVAPLVYAPFAQRSLVLMGAAID